MHLLGCATCQMAILHTLDAGGLPPMLSNATLRCVSVVLLGMSRLGESSLSQSILDGCLRLLRANQASEVMRGV